MKSKSGLGIVHIKGEGAPMHPETIYGSWKWSHEKFMEQAKQYYKYHGLDDEWEDFKAFWNEAKQ